ncbi:unnamed protein product [Schistocephalus solidus]|uniref:Mercuric transport protein MerT n=1 Tax=Schistocephalus solidus TaxID=70667 RepID=A0A183THW9_SCHSO|nr:unnamed protein product [Schistocephalus solidus]
MCTSKPVVVAAETILSSIGAVMTAITIMLAFAPCAIVAGIVLLTAAASKENSARLPNFALLCRISFAAGATAVLVGLTILPILVVMRHKAKRVRQQTLILEAWIYKHVKV